MKVKISSVGAYVPSRRVSNEELSRMVDTSDEWIRSHTGIENRHLCEKDQAASDLAVEAAKIALEKGSISADEIDLVIVATASPDYIGFPSCSCIVQERLGLTQCGAFDLAAGCTGFVYSLEVARSMLSASSYKHALVIGVEALSKITNWKDRNTCVLFGDGAGAAVLSRTEEDDNSGFIDSILGSDGSGAEALIRRAGGSKEPFDREESPEQDLYIAMDGRRVYNFAVRVNTEMFQNILQRNELSYEELAWVVPHQANVRIIKAAAGRLGIEMDKFFMNIQEYANTSAASIPIALSELWDSGKLQRGDLLLLMGFGAGLTYGANLLRW